MNLRLLKIALFFVIILQGGCKEQKKQDIYKEGEIVTWKFNDQLIIKAKVGPRREHIPDTHCKRCEREFYRPSLEHYLGQFPIEYKPKEIPELTNIEAKTIPHALVGFSRGAFEFNLMLNGSKVQATDANIHGRYLDHPDQIKVVVDRLLRSEKKNSKEFFFSERMKKLNIRSKQTQYGLDCYELKDDSMGKMCFGYSKNNFVSGFYFYVSPNQDTQLFVQSQEFILGGVQVNWIIDQKHIDKVHQVDANIWRLLNTWNVSPINHDQIKQ